MYKSIYNKREIEPKDIESKFDIDELFFSSTNLKGTILSGNDVFVRVSKFNKDELIGKPHNIIRHPDMPRAVFKALWQTIKNRKPFIGYVKNIAKDGSYYWVLACVYPMFDEEGNIKKYLSIRLKPTSDIFKIIPEFYKDVLRYEHREGMDAALNYMLEKIKELGFENYEEFSKKAFLEEMKSREEKLKNKDMLLCGMASNVLSKENEELADTLCILQTNFLRLNRYFNEIYSKVNIFLEMNKNLNEKSKFIFQLAEEIRLLSLNASIESYKIKKEGVSFSTLSQEMRKNAEYSEREILNLTKLINQTNKDIEDTSFNILSCKLQIDMVVYFLKEMLEKLVNEKISIQEEKEIINNIKDLFELLNSYAKKLSNNIYDSKSRLRNIFYNIKDLNVLINRLDFIHINGLIESAHAGNEGGSFTIIFSQMLKLVEAAKNQIVDLETNITAANEENLSIDILTDLIETKLLKLEKKYENIFA
ncbi:methyl-accepting chemotaxis protein [Nitrosophilus kaiyonis]|uniref:methyl-accepting chemotaxis protein n=1 Tax=Nitrosophilus kaiyonis TaxID=2930200 RepID=UPI002490898A|nr:PAS domain-containing methyl-accepting chemotaxis protein [Nitrosophilus kaiyonis]